MLLGYSVLLREYINAVEIDYGDCIDFQITCPACHEAIFKVGKVGGDRQYLSHYAASKSNVKQCELRVASISNEVILQDNAIGHGQTIERFFDKLRDFLMQWLFAQNPGDWAPQLANVDVMTLKKHFTAMSVRPSFVEFAALNRKAWLKGLAENNSLLDASATDILSAGRSQLWIDRQMSYGREMAHHILAPNSDSTWRFIMAIASMMTVLPDRYRTVFYFANDKKLWRFLTCRPSGKSTLNETTYHALCLYIGRTIALIMATIPYVDMLAGNTNDTSNRQFLMERIRRAIKADATWTHYHPNYQPDSDYVADIKP